MDNQIQLELQDEDSDGQIFLSAHRTAAMNRAQTPQVELQITCKRFSVDFALSVDEAGNLGKFLYQYHYTEQVEEQDVPSEAVGVLMELNACQIANYLMSQYDVVVTGLPQPDSPGSGEE